MSPPVQFGVIWKPSKKHGMTRSGADLFRIDQKGTNPVGSETTSRLTQVRGADRRQRGIHFPLVTGHTIEFMNKDGTVPGMIEQGGSG